MRLRREQEQAARQQTDAELLALGDLDGAVLSASAMARFQQLFGRASHRASGPDGERQSSDAGIRCVIRREPGTTAVSSPEGTLTLHGLRVRIEAVRRARAVDGRSRTAPVSDGDRQAVIDGDPQAVVDRRRCARRLLQRPLTCAEHDPELFRLIRRHEAELDRWFTQRLGYRLHIDADTARLFKLGTVPDHRPLRTKSDRAFRPIEYTLLGVGAGVDRGRTVGHQSARPRGRDPLRRGRGRRRADRRRTSSAGPSSRC